MVEGSSMVVGIQYGGGISLIRLRIFSTNVSHYQHGGGTSSVQWRGYAVWACHIINTEKGVQYSKNPHIRNYFFQIRLDSFL